MRADVRPQATPETFKQMFAEIPGGTPGKPVLVGYNYFASSGSTQAWVSLQYEFPGEYVLVQAGVDSTTADSLLYALHIERLPDALERLNAFTLRSKSWRHYLFLVLALAVPSFITFALVQCARTSFPRRKWMWMLFVALGYGQFTMNWTTGEVRSLPISIQLLGAGAQTASPYAPWLVSFSAPLGALIFLYQRRRRLQATNGGEPSPATGVAHESDTRLLGNGED
jgi:hypothetical protein